MSVPQMSRSFAIPQVMVPIFIVCLTLSGFSHRVTGVNQDDGDDKKAQRRGLQIRGHHKFHVADSDCHTWGIPLLRAKQLILRLRLIHEGKSVVSREVSYRMERKNWGDDSTTANAEVLLVMQHGKQDDQLRLSLDVDISDDLIAFVLAPERTEKGSVATLDGKLVLKGGISIGLPLSPPARECCFYAVPLAPESSIYRLGGERSPQTGIDMGDLIKRSTVRPDVTFVALTAEWHALD
jgi:hypothetical protein